MEHSDGGNGCIAKEDIPVVVDSVCDHIPPGEENPLDNYPDSNMDVDGFSQDELVAQSAKLCYSAASIDELQKQIESRDQKGFINKLADIRQHLPVEHVSFTFGVEGVSRR